MYNLVPDSLEDKETRFLYILMLFVGVKRRWMRRKNKLVKDEKRGPDSL